MKFIVGDKIAAYSIKENGDELTSVRSVGTISKILSDKICLAPGVWFVDKQCRKLIKKERRRIWIYKSEFEEITDSKNFSCLKNNPLVFIKRSEDQTELLEFVEVKKR